jgi:phospholipase C
MTIRKNTSLLAAILSLAVAFGLLSRVVPVHAEDTHNTRFRTPFKHVVVIFQENRTPDNLFQGLCQPPFGHSHSCSTTPTERQYNISTTGWLDKHSPPG